MGNTNNQKEKPTTTTSVEKNLENRLCNLESRITTLEKKNSPKRVIPFIPPRWFITTED